MIEGSVLTHAIRLVDRNGKHNGKPEISIAVRGSSFRCGVEVVNDAPFDAADSEARSSSKFNTE